MRAQSPRAAHANHVQSLMQEYSLSSEEGVALMCLAEALLRIPDAATRDALIRDKVGNGDWHKHLSHSSSFFVNATTWGLLLTGKLLAKQSNDQSRSAFVGLVANLGEPLIRKSIDLATRMLGEHFVMGETIERALTRSNELALQGFRFSFDMLGEAALTSEDAARYMLAYEQAIHIIGRVAKGHGVYGGPGISVKLSALHSRYCRAQRTRVMHELFPRLLKLTELARHYDIGLNIDAEESDRLDLSLDLLEGLCQSTTLAGWNGIGFVIQAYQKRCSAVVDYLIDMARHTGHRLMIRLVKGAYWDTEIKRAQVDGQIDYQVFTRKQHTDVSYLACARKLLAAPDAIYPQFATHNVRTVAHIIYMAGKYTADQYEFQCLHGMGESLYEQVLGQHPLNRPCRIYAPVGTYASLLAYLVRRLLENGANTSFVNRMADPAISLDVLLQDPLKLIKSEAQRSGGIAGLPHPKIPLPQKLYGSLRLNSTGMDLSDEPTLKKLSQELSQYSGPMFIRPIMAYPCSDGERYALFNPADAGDLVGTVQFAQSCDVEAALKAAWESASTWAATSPDQRATLLEFAALRLQDEAPRFIALLVREAGKTWAHGVSEVREAIDFLRYYAQQVRSSFDCRTCRALGPVLCISPWNFPLAIFVGQVAAALVAGNPVIAKPAKRTPAIAALVVQVLLQAGVPPSVLQLITGRGREVGLQLVQDSRVQGVMFTGSTDTARVLQATLARRLNMHGQFVPFIAETGGQNVMLVDSSALLEQVVTDAIASAFEAAGQRCSALRILCVQNDIADRLIELLKGAMTELVMGAPAQLSVDVGPVIDDQSKADIEAHVAAMQNKGCEVFRLSHTDAINTSKGSYVQPTLIEIGHISMLEREVFGPVLHVLRYARDDLDSVLDAMNATEYGLTLGIHSRIDEAVSHVIKKTFAGNVYVNRNMVGAVVGVQPFGGERLSGTGPKAGGPLYLLKLLSACPEGKARGNLESSCATGPSAMSDELRALMQWALEQDNLSLHQYCARVAISSPSNMKSTLIGPTGECNLYYTQPRKRVLCLSNREDHLAQDLLVQLAAVLCCGGRAVWSTQHRVLFERLPRIVQRAIELQDLELLTNTKDIQVALLHDDSEVPAEALRIAVWLSCLSGPLINLHRLKNSDEYVPLSSLISERSISINTAAAGGNASLMTLS